jgi:hypothetical protein
MVNFSLNAGSLMGIILAFAGAGLYFLRSFRPNLARDYDVFFAAIALICGGILFFQSWRLDPILQFGVFLLAGSTVFFAADSIRLRSIATEQAKRSTPVVDDARPVSRSYQYQAELDDYDSFEDRQPLTRRIRGSRDSRSSGYAEEGELERRPSSNNRRSSRPTDWDDRSYGQEVQETRSRRPRSRPNTSSDRPSRKEWTVEPEQEAPYRNESPRQLEEERPPSSSRSQRSDSSSRRPPKRRPPTSVMSRSGYRASLENTDSSPYVDYQPLGSTDDEFDNSSNFDDD